jgi:G3E family GTPase
LEEILRRRDNGRIAPFERVIIETTGLADPAPVLQTILVHPYLALRSRLDGVVTLIDAVNGSSTLDAHEEAVKQAAMADRLVLSKTDLLTEGGALRDLCCWAVLTALADDPARPVIIKASSISSAAAASGLARWRSHYSHRPYLARYGTSFR